MYANCIIYISQSYYFKNSFFLKNSPLKLNFSDICYHEQAMERFTGTFKIPHQEKSGMRQAFLCCNHSLNF